MNLMAVAIGGFLGAILRYQLGQWIQVESGFPLGTLMINLMGCLILGWFLTYTTHNKVMSPSVGLGVGTGLLGAFTTFSTFSVETVKLIQKGSLGWAIIYVSLSVGIGIFFAFLGFRVAKVQVKGE